MSIPCSAAGKRPTAAVSLVRPPTQSHIGRKSSHPFSCEYWWSLLPSPVIAIACFEKSNPFWVNAFSASSMPFRVSGVPPDLEITRARVVPRASPISERVWSIPSGSVLSKKCTRSLSAFGLPKALPTNWGPKAEPPIPMTSRSVKVPCGDWRDPEWTAWDTSFTLANVSRIAWVRSSLGASSGSRNQ